MVFNRIIAPFCRPLGMLPAIAVVASCLAVLLFVARSRGIGPVEPGPSDETAQVVRDICRIGRFDHERYNGLQQMLLRRSIDEQACYGQDVYSLATDEALYPMHGQLLAFLTVPAYWLIGEPAFAAIPILLAGLSVLSVLYLPILFGAGPPTLLDLVVVLLGTPILLYGPGFGYDSLNTALVAFGLCCLMVRPWAGGILLGLTLFIRPTNVFFLPLVLLSGMAGGDAKRKILQSGATAFLVTTLFAFYNYCMWGDPFTVINHRMPVYCGGQIQFYDPEVSIGALAKDWMQKLFGADIGYVRYSPVLLLLPWSLYRLRQTRVFPYAVLVSVLCLVNAAVIFGFHCWMCTANGNRFLLPTSALAAAVVLLSLRADRLRGEKGRGVLEGRP